MADEDRTRRAQSQSRPSDEDPLDKRERELEEVRRYVDKTSFGGDEREVADELSSADQHPADTADITFQREMDQTVRRIVDVEEEQIRQARQRQAEGKYGICENCGREINPERLQARPEATLCIDCQREREREFGSQRR